jgi:hypothetical protein
MPMDNKDASEFMASTAPSSILIFPVTCKPYAIQSFFSFTFLTEGFINVPIFFHLRPQPKHHYSKK